MGLFDKSQMIAALRRLGELAAAKGTTARLFVIGGARIVLVTGERATTKDVDAVTLGPSPAEVRHLAEAVASELGLPNDWLNDAAKGYVGEHVDGEIVFAAEGIEVIAAPDAQMLALKLWAWRDDTDIDDAKAHLLRLTGTREEIWTKIEGYISDKNALHKVDLAYAVVWELAYGPD